MSLKRHFDSIDGAAYSFAIERPWFAKRWAKFVWRGDLEPFYRRLELVASAPEGATVVDCPVGSGVALSALKTRPDVAYVGVDNSPGMLDRARRKAAGLENVTLHEADVASLPVDDASVDLYLSHWGLHCFEDPRAALREAARVTRSGGRLIGECFVRGELPIQRRMIKPGVSVFRSVGYREEVESWIEESGFDLTDTDARGPMLYFDAVRR